MQRQRPSSSTAHRPASASTSKRTAAARRDELTRAYGGRPGSPAVAANGRPSPYASGRPPAAGPINGWASPSRPTSSMGGRRTPVTPGGDQDSKRIAQIEELWRELHIPAAERKHYADLLFTERSPQVSEELRDLLTQLQQHRELTLNVMKGIHNRERALARLRNVENLFTGKKAPIKYVQAEIKTICDEIRSATVSVVEAILEWRVPLTRPMPFIWHGKNYLLKMNDDLHEFINAVFAPYLPCFVVNNPLLILPRAKFDRAEAIYGSSATRPASPDDRVSRLQDTMMAENGGLRHLQAAEKILRSEQRLVETLQQERRSTQEQGLFMLTLGPPETEPQPLPEGDGPYRELMSHGSQPSALEALPNGEDPMTFLAHDADDSLISNFYGTRPSRPSSPSRPTRRTEDHVMFVDGDHYVENTPPVRGVSRQGARGEPQRGAAASRGQPGARSAAPPRSPSSAGTRQSEREEEDAAVKIQSAFRGHQVRKSQKNQKKPAAGAKTGRAGPVVRSPVAKSPARRPLHATDEQHAAAVAIQSRYRGHLERRKFADKKATIDKNKKAAADKQKKANDKLAEKARQKKEQELAATKIQAGFRGARARQDVKKKKVAVAKKQQSAARQAERNAAATKIQRQFRGHQARRRVDGMKTKKKAALSKKTKEQEDGALLIQSRFRGRKLRDEEKRKNVAATKVQANYRGHLARKEVEVHRVERSNGEARRQERAAVTIQSGYRGYVARKDVTPKLEKLRAQELGINFEAIPSAILKVTLNSARNIEGKRGNVYPYCCVSVDEQIHTSKTDRSKQPFIHMNTDFYYDLAKTSPMAVLQIVMFDRKLRSKKDPTLHKEIGRTTFALSMLVKNSPVRMWLPLMNSDERLLEIQVMHDKADGTKVPLGEIVLSLQRIIVNSPIDKFVTLDNAAEGARLGLQLQYKVVEGKPLVTGVVREAANLAKVDGQAPHPYVTMRLDKYENTLKKARSTCDPQWNQAFVIPLPDDPNEHVHNPPGINVTALLFDTLEVAKHMALNPPEPPPEGAVRAAVSPNRAREGASPPSGDAGENNAARLIQAQYRGHRERRLSQPMIAGNKARKAYETMLNTPSSLSAADIRKNTPTALRKVAKRRKSNTKRSGSNLDASADSQGEWNQEDREHAAATTIQSTYRGYRTRKQLSSRPPRNITPADPVVVRGRSSKHGGTAEKVSPPSRVTVNLSESLKHKDADTGKATKQRVFDVKRVGGTSPMGAQAGEAFPHSPNRSPNASATGESMRAAGGQPSLKPSDAARPDARPDTRGSPALAEPKHTPPTATTDTGAAAAGGASRAPATGALPPRSPKQAHRGDPTAATGAGAANGPKDPGAPRDGRPAAATPATAAASPTNAGAGAGAGASAGAAAPATGSPARAVSTTEPHAPRPTITVPGGSFSSQFTVVAKHSDKDGKRALLVTLTNTGTTEASLATSTLIVSSADPKFKGAPVRVSDFSKRSVAPGDKRKLRVDFPLELPFGPVNAKLVMLG